MSESGESPGGGTWRTFNNGKARMQLNSFHDMIAAISAYVSLLEHDLVLALAFSDFDPSKEDLTVMIGSRWGEKWGRILGKEGEAGRYWQRLFDVVERWRNPYSHGGFEKGHGATIFLHTPGVNAAVPSVYLASATALCSPLCQLERRTSVMSLHSSMKSTHSWEGLPRQSSGWILIYTSGTTRSSGWNLRRRTRR